MPELQFKGKEFVYNHHLTVPFRPLEMHADKGIGEARLDGNLIVHGDNLHALKALLPMYAGKVDCIFIDPPYNTGNEGWAYNDNVNSPMIREWLSANPIGLEDGLRHDKWACMMWPRLKLLHELLAEGGTIWITLDANELHRAKLLMDEIFGASNFLTNAVWEKSDSPRMDAKTFSSSCDFVLAYARDADQVVVNRIIDEDGEPASHYSHRDEEDRPYYLKPLRAMGSGEDTREARPSMFFALTAPDGEEVLPKRADGSDGRWRWGPNKAESEAWRIEWRGQSGSWTPYFRIYDSGEGRPPETIWYHQDVGSSRTAMAQIKRIFGSAVFETPKPIGLIARILEIVGKPDAVVLDSFAGSGTTAHAVLAANARDGGNRRFILVEGEDYADTLTAERVRRVINGYAFTGTQREELLREPLTLAKLRNAATLLERVQQIETLDGPKFDRIAKTVRDGALIVTGERDVAEQTPGLGGTFTYCTLGEPIEMDAILSGDALPDEAAMAGLLWHTATATPLPADAMTPAPEIGDGVARLGAFAGRTYWLIYRPDLDWLKSADAALSLTKARAVAATAPGNHLVFAPAKFVSRELLSRERIDVDYAPLPFALYRLETA